MSIWVIFVWVLCCLCFGLLFQLFIFLIFFPFCWRWFFLIQKQAIFNHLFAFSYDFTKWFLYSNCLSVTLHQNSLLSKTIFILIDMIDKNNLRLLDIASKKWLMHWIKGKRRREGEKEIPLLFISRQDSWGQCPYCKTVVFALWPS